MSQGQGLGVTKVRDNFGPSYDPGAKALFAAYLAATGTEIPDEFKTHYNNYFKNLRGTGTKGSENCFIGYKINRALAGYYDGVNKFLMLCDLFNPTASLSTEKNGGGNYVNVGTNPATFTRESVSTQCWSAVVVPSTLTVGTLLNDFGVGQWNLLSTAGASSSLYAIGVGNSGAEVSMSRAATSSQAAFAVNESTYYFRSYSPGNNKGYFRMERTTNLLERAYQNESQLGADASIASVALPARQIMMYGFSTSNGVTISQTGNGQRAGVGLVIYVPSLTHSAMHTQYFESTKQFLIDIGISSPHV